MKTLNRQKREPVGTDRETARNLAEACESWVEALYERGSHRETLRFHERCLKDPGFAPDHIPDHFPTLELRIEYDRLRIREAEVALEAARETLIARIVESTPDYSLRSYCFECGHRSVRHGDLTFFVQESALRRERTLLVLNHADEIHTNRRSRIST